MTSVRRLEHAGLYVTDIEQAVDFYRDVFGLLEIDREGDVVYLGCGRDGNFDLALSGGATGVEHLAVRVGDRNVDEYEQILSDSEVSTARIDGDEPGIEDGVKFELPSGQFTMEIVSVEDARYHNPADVEALPTSPPVHPDRSPIAPRDLDHIGIYSSDIEADVEFLQDVLDFRISDVGLREDGEWNMVFTRAGQHHHEVVLFNEPGEETLGHIAWDMTDMSHLQQFADHLTSNGYQLETPIVRHGPGSNISTYLVAPGGNRSEMTTDVETVDPNATAQTHEMAEMPFCVWSNVSPPESLHEGS